MDRSRALKFGILALVGLGIGGGLLLVRGAPSASPPTGAAADNKPAPAAVPSDCRACEKQQCPVLVADCVAPECTAALDCFIENKCSRDEDHLYNCYCGATVKEDCFMGKAPPQGVCRKQFEAAAHTSTALDVGRRFFDRESAVGQAMQVAACMLRNCPGCP